jgi:hypothetical protein
MSDSEAIYCAYSYSEGRCVEAAHKIQRAMEQWHRRVMMLPQEGIGELHCAVSRRIRRDKMVSPADLLWSVYIGQLFNSKKPRSC